MSATVKLCAMLEERGIDYRIDTVDGAVLWETQACDDACAVELSGGKLVFTGIFTPAQVIAAMLGKRTCTDVSVKDGYFKCSECGCTVFEESVDYGGINYCPDCGKEIVD